MGKALYRKYRSKNLDEVVGQEHITTTLKRALESGRISHAYLLTGPRGVGKTSVARILAYKVNDLPYTKDGSHIDIIEIDAASNRRIDEIRDLRDKVHTVPALVAYKVYIIDEVHMLTREAFNALLKTLEEPPAHAIFILATTDLHKLPDTIISRCIHFHFKPISEQDIISHLKAIAKTENITISDEALQVIAQHSDGSFRDSISMLDQSAALADKIERDDVERLLGVVPGHLMSKLYDSVCTSDPAQILMNIQQLIEQGLPPSNIAKQLASRVRDSLSTRDGLPLQEKINLLERLLSVPKSSEPRITLEISVLQVVSSKEQPKSTSSLPKPQPVKEQVSQSPEQQNVSSPMIEKEKIKPTVEVPKKDLEKRSRKTDPTLTTETWNELLTLVRKRHNTLYSILRMAQAVIVDGTLQLTLAFVFHQKRLDEAKNKKIIAKIAEEVYKQPLQIECLVDPSLKNTSDVPPSNNSEEKPLPKNEVAPESIQNISNIFGSAEMLE